MSIPIVEFVSNENDFKKQPCYQRNRVALTHNSIPALTSICKIWCVYYNFANSQFGRRWLFCAHSNDIYHFNSQTVKFNAQFHLFSSGDHVWLDKRSTLWSLVFLIFSLLVPPPPPASLPVCDKLNTTWSLQALVILLFILNGENYH